MQQLKKGVLELLVLGLLCKKPAYGYELLGVLTERSNGLFRLREGTLYPILYRLEDDGLIRSNWQPAEGRTAPKKIYTATPEGQQAFARRRALWADFQRTIERMLQGVEENENPI